MVRMSVNSVLGFLVASIMLTLVMTQASAYTIDGDTVYIDDSNIYLGVYPKTITDGNCFYIGDEIEQLHCIFDIEFNPKLFTGEVDIAFGFEKEVMIPTGLYVKQGENYNLFTKEYTKLEEEHAGKDVWYIIKNLNVNAGTLYKAKLAVKISKGEYGKFDIAVKRSSDTISSAISSGTFYLLDPWYDAAYAYRRQLNTTCSSCQGAATVMIPFNGTDYANISDSLELFWGFMEVNTENSYVYYNNETDMIIVQNDSYQVPFIPEESNTSQNGGYPDPKYVMWIDGGSNNCNATFCSDMSVYQKKYIKKDSNEPIANSSGKIGHAQSYDGQNDYIRLDDDDFWNSAFGEEEPIYIAGWFYIEEPRLGAPSNYNFVMVRNGHFSVSVDSNAKPYFEYWFNSSTRSQSSGSNGDITYNEWVFIEMIHTGTDNQGTIYINGVNQTDAQIISTSPRVTTNPTTIGFSDGTVYYNGMMDTILMINETVNSDERMAIRTMLDKTINTVETEEELPTSPPSVTIESPTGSDTHTAYDTTETVNLNWSYVGYNETDVCTSSSYRVDSGSWVDTSCANSTILLTGAPTSWTITVNATNQWGYSDTAETTYTIEAVMATNLTFLSAVNVSVEGSGEWFNDTTNLTLYETDIGNNKLVTIRFGLQNQLYEFITGTDSAIDTVGVVASNYSIGVHVIGYGDGDVDAAKVRVYYSPWFGSKTLIGQYYTKTDGTAVVIAENEVFSNMHLNITKTGYAAFEDYYNSVFHYSVSSPIEIRLDSGSIEVSSEPEIVVLTKSPIEELPAYIEAGIAVKEDSDLKIMALHGGTYDSSMEVECLSEKNCDYNVSYNTNETLTLEFYVNDVKVGTKVLTVIDIDILEVVILENSEAYEAYQGLAMMLILAMSVLAIGLGGFLSKTRGFYMIMIGAAIVNPFFLFPAVPCALILFKDVSERVRNNE